MRPAQICLPLVAAGIASLLVASSASGPAAREPRSPCAACSRAAATHRQSGRPLYGYYTRHGQYVPGAGDRLIYGPGYVFVPGRGILDEACNLPSSTCTNEYRDVH
jgi:hypothetical protein